LSPRPSAVIQSDTFNPFQFSPAGELRAGPETGAKYGKSQSHGSPQVVGTARREIF
jgi:hypothetical protein